MTAFTLTPQCLLNFCPNDIVVHFRGGGVILPAQGRLSTNSVQRRCPAWPQRDHITYFPSKQSKKMFRGDNLWLLLFCTGGGFFIKNISSSHRKGTFHYTTEYEGPLSQYDFSNPHCCTDLCNVILNIYVQIYAFQISHPYDIDTCTIKEQCLSLEMFNLEIVLYHTLCLYVEYAVLCGNKVLLNLNLKRTCVFYQLIITVYAPKSWAWKRCVLYMSRCIISMWNQNW